MLIDIEIVNKVKKLAELERSIGSVDYFLNHFGLSKKHANRRASYVELLDMVRQLENSVGFLMQAMKQHGNRREEYELFNALLSDF